MSNEDVLPTVYGDAGGQEARPVVIVDENGDVVPQATSTDAYFVAAGESGLTTDGGEIIIDPSDTSGYPHTETGGIKIDALYAQVGKTNSATGNVLFGVIVRIDETDADVKVFQGITFNNASDRQILRDRNYAPNSINIKVVGGEVPAIVSSGVLTTTVFNTSGTNETPIGTATPAVGDFVVLWANTAGTFDYSVSAFYETIA